MLLVGLGFFLSIGYVAPKIPFNFTPKNDNGQINIDLALPKGTALSETDALSRRLESWLQARSEVRAVLNTVGSSQNILGGGNPERARIVVELVNRDERPYVYDLLPIYREALQGLLADRPEAELRVTVPEGGRVGPPICSLP